MLELFRKMPTSSPAPSSKTAESMPSLSPATASDPDVDINDEEQPPAKKMKMATVKETVRRRTYLEGRLVHDEWTQRAFMQPVDENKYTLP